MYFEYKKSDPEAVMLFEVSHYDIMLSSFLWKSKKISAFFFFKETISTRFYLTCTHIHNMSLQNHCDVNV